MNINTYQHCPATGTDTHTHTEWTEGGGKMERWCEFRGGVNNCWDKISALAEDRFHKHELNIFRLNSSDDCETKEI